MAATYAPKGMILEEGEIAFGSTYADNLETIATKGPDAFYEGPIARAAVNAVQAMGGILDPTVASRILTFVLRALQS